MIARLTGSGRPAEQGGAIVTLAYQDITKIGSEVIRNYPHQTVEFVSVVSSGGDRVEVMVTVKGCHTQPCNLMFNLPRSDKASFEQEFRRALERELHDHMLGHKH